MRPGIVSVVIVGAIALALVGVGCGGSDDPSATPSTTETETTTDVTTPPPTTDTAERTPDPEGLVPQLSDLPTGYSLDREHTGPVSLTTALEKRTPEETALIKAERIAGYEIQFQSTNLRVINCAASVYRSSEGAEQVFRLGNELAPGKAKKEGGTVEPASIDESLGDETAAFTSEFEGASIFIVAWRDRNVLGLCLTGGLVATDPAETVRVARAQQERMAQALG